MRRSLRSPLRFRRPAGFAALASVALAALAGAGCGENGDQVSEEELIARGDRICAEGQKRFAEVQAAAPQSAAVAAEQTEKLLQIATDSLNELRDIRPPEDLRERYDAYLEARARALELLAKGRNAAADEDAESYGRAQVRAAAEQKQRLRLARAVGFEVCSRG
ncbi:MAG: hypothetical protein K0S15_145 [Solirubrobacterales bacterium]|jgi:hypothetical protein|nr:hypothetical protein [Solirubrobacterales bacterium]